MTDRNRTPMLVSGDWVSQTAAGLGEAVLLQDSEHRFQTWQSMQYRITPDLAWGALAHLEASGFGSPGDAPVLFGLATAGIPAGSTDAQYLYNRAQTASSNLGAEWDAGDSADPWARVRAIRDQIAAQNTAAYENGTLDSPGGWSWAPGQGPADVEVPESNFSAFGLLKGASRWVMLAFDAIPEGIDAMQRAILHVKAGNLSPGEAIGGMLGINRQAGQLVGVPLFQYLADVNPFQEGGSRRVAQGSGWFAQGEIAPDIQQALARYDAETEGSYDPVTGKTDDAPARETFARLAAQNSGKVYVPGPAGEQYLASNFEEWQFLRRNAGRAALLSTMQYTSPNQAALGQAYGTFNESILDEGVIARNSFNPVLGGSNKYYVPSAGRTIASTLVEPSSDPFDVLSAPIDLGKQLVDLQSIGVTRALGPVVNMGKKFIGLGEEAGSLIRASETAKRVVAGADAAGIDGLVRDLGAQTINRELATNALARGADASLQTANTFTQAALHHAPGVLRSRRQQQVLALVRDGVSREQAYNMVGDVLSEGRIQDLVRRAAKGEAPAQKWLTDLMVEAPTRANLDDVTRSVANLADVTGRGGVDLVAGQFGQAVVDDAIRTAARSEVDNLANLLEGRKASFVTDRAKVIKDPQKGLMLTYDADLGQAQSTLQKLYDHIDETQQGTAEMLQGRKDAMLSNLFNERWVTQRWAEKALGDTDEASRAVANLQRVLKRNGAVTDLVNHADSFARVMPEGKIRDLLMGNSAMQDMVQSFVEAKTMRDVDAILGPSKELMGRTIDPRLKVLLAEATTPEQVVEALIQSGATTRLIPQRIGLLGNYARAGNLLTSGGVAVGGVAGAINAAGQDNASAADIIGGAVSGAIVGGLLGSGVAGVAGVVGGGTTRSIDNVADAMDVMLAGTRATTADFLRAHGVDAGRAQAGLSVPSQLSYGFGHSSWGRRMARSYRSTVNINDPFDMYYTLTDMARSFGVTTDDVVTVMRRGVGPGADINRIVRSTFKSVEDYEAAIANAVKDGYEVARTLNLDDAFKGIANLQSNNTGAAWVAMRELFDGVENILVDKGMSEELAGFLTRFAKQGSDEFLGNIDAIGHGANYAQGMLLNGTYSNLENAPLMMSEMWSGKVSLPPPAKVHRAVGQLDTLGTIGTVFTGKGAAKRAIDKLRGRMPDVDWGKAITAQTWDQLERNTATTAARAITSALWAPMVLATRPISFMSRVLGEDQARMTAAGLDSFFAHPFNYITAVASDAHLRGLKPRGVAARSLIPDNMWDEAGNLVEDAFDRYNHLAISERVQAGLGIYNREEAAGRKVFGQTHWTTVRKGTPTYKRSIAGEFRQLLTDPIARKMAASTADDVVDDTLRWLTETGDGRKVAADWARQFADPKQAELYLANDDAMRAFLEDQYARLHLKSGGDWIFVVDQQGTKIAFTSQGEILQAAESGIDLTKYDTGYHLMRDGDPELLRVIADGKLPDSWLSKVNDQATLEGKALFDGVLRGQLDERKWNEIHDYVSAKHDTFEQALRRQDADASFPRFPEVVKGTRLNVEVARQKVSLIARWDDALDRFYDRILGQPTNWFSRQPTLGQYYWERMGLMYHSMSDDVAKKVMSLAEAEGMGGRVRRIADALADEPMARGIIDNFDVMDLNAKAYAVERTKDILFDLTRQRNFIDGMRVVTPFVGPLVEALEAWGRVVKGNPVWVWRRGTQLINHLWDTDPLALQKETGFGTFWVNDKGEEMFTFPFSGPVMNWMHDNINQGISAGPVSGRARGLNVVFGTDDLSDPNQPTFAGVPIAGLNPGQGPAFTLPVSFLLKDKEGVLADVNNFLFPYGPPNNALESFMPFHLRKILEGWTGAASRREQVRTAGEQFNAMVAGGLVGEGSQFEYNTLQAGEVDRAWKEAVSRGRWASLVEGVLRGSTPTMVSPDVYVKLPEMQENGVNTDGLMNLTALQTEARNLYSQEGAQTYDLPDGTQISTEGDWEAITAYLNDKYGMDVFSASLLTMSPSTTIHPRQYTAAGRIWMNGRGSELASMIPNSTQLLMPDYGIHENDPVDFAAREDAIARGDLGYADINEYELEIQSRLLSLRNREIELQATRAFGPDDLLSGQDQAEKDAWINQMKQQATGIYEQAASAPSSTEKVLNELLTWDSKDWASANLRPEEQVTVDAMTWYLQMEDMMTSYAAGAGLTKITNKGSTDRQKEAGAAARADLIQVVEAQLEYSAQNGHNLGNFPYLWERYLKPRLTMDESDDPLMHLAELESPWGAGLETLRDNG